MPKGKKKAKWPRPSEEDRIASETIRHIERGNLDWKNKFLELFANTMIKEKYLENPLKEIKLMNQIEEKITMSNVRRDIIELNKQGYNAAQNEEEGLKFLFNAYGKFSKMRLLLDRKQIHEAINKWGETPVRAAWESLIAGREDISEKHLTKEHVKKQLLKFSTQLSELIDKEKSSESDPLKLTLKIINLAKENGLLWPEVEEYIRGNPKIKEKLDKRFIEMINKQIKSDEDLRYIR